jgi:hypothetical protein
VIPGVELTLGGRRLVVPPMSLGTLELMHERLAQLATLPATDPSAVRTLVDATHAALQRNYPAMTREEVGQLVDLGNMTEVYEALMDVSGVKRRAQVEAAAGNVQPVSPTPTAGAASSPA